jgi:hypothetical protein
MPQLFAAPVKGEAGRGAARRGLRRRRTGCAAVIHDTAAALKGRILHKLYGASGVQNLTMLLRVSVMLAVTTAGPPPPRWYAAYCSR